MNGFVFYEGLSVFWSDSVSLGMREWLQHLTLVVFFIIHQMARKYVDHGFVKRVSLCFISSTSVLFLLSLLIRLWVAPINWSSISQDNLATAIVDLHYLTFAVYVSFAFLLSLHHLLQKQESSQTETRALVVALIVLGPALFLLASRTVLLITLLLCVGYFLSIFHWRKAVFLTLCTLSIFTMTFSIPGLRTKFLEGINYQDQYSIQNTWGGRSFRELIWNCSLHVIKRQPLLGSGYGDELMDLDLCYHQYRYGPLYHSDKQFNSHNIYLQMAIGTGLFGLGFLFLSLGYQFFYAFRARHFLFVSLLGLLILGGLTESYLNRNAFILFFGFFSMLFYSEIAIDEGTSGS